MDIEISEIKVINVDSIYKTVTVRLDDVKIFLNLEQAEYLKEQLDVLERISKLTKRKRREIKHEAFKNRSRRKKSS